MKEHIRFAINIFHTLFQLMHFFKSVITLYDEHIKHLEINLDILFFLLVHYHNLGVG